MLREETASIYTLPVLQYGISHFDILVAFFRVYFCIVRHAYFYSVLYYKKTVKLNGMCHIILFLRHSASPFAMF